MIGAALHLMQTVRYAPPDMTSIRAVAPPSTAPDAPVLRPVVSRYLSAGEVVAGRYEVRERLGVGGMGAVYRVFDRSLSEEVALKVLRIDLASSPVALDRFGAETKLGRKISHPNVCRVFDIGRADGFVFLTMELVAGETLRTHIARGDLPVLERIRLFEQIARGLAAVHARGTLHRDLKPENVLVRPDGTALVADFGLAMLLDETTGAPDPAGTPMYMSPEQLRGEPLDARSDVFALGLVGYELLTGKRPFGSEPQGAVTTAILRDPPAPPVVEGVAPELAAALADLLLLALEKDSAKRWPNAAVMVDGLTQVLVALGERLDALDEATSLPSTESPIRLDTTTPIDPSTLKASRGWRGSTRLLALAVFVLGVLGTTAAPSSRSASPSGTGSSLTSSRAKALPAASTAIPDGGDAPNGPLVSIPSSEPVQTEAPRLPPKTPAQTPVGRLANPPTRPVKVHLDHPVKQLYAGKRSVMAVTSDNAVWVWDNQSAYGVDLGQKPLRVDLPSGFAPLLSRRSDYGKELLLTNSDGALAIWRGTGELIAPEMLGLSSVSAVTTSGDHLLILHGDGALSLVDMASKFRDSGDFPRPEPVSVPGHWKAIASGSCFAEMGSCSPSAALGTDGRIATWKHITHPAHHGSQAERILAKTEIRSMETLPYLADVIAIALWHQAWYGDVLALDGRGLVHVYSRKDQGWGPPLAMTPAVSIAAAGGAAAAVDQRGRVWVWGRYAARPTGARMDTASPSMVIGLPAVSKIWVGDHQSFAVDTRGALWIW